MDLVIQEVTTLQTDLLNKRERHLSLKGVPFTFSPAEIKPKKKKTLAGQIRPGSENKAGNTQHNLPQA
jgi:hypothetical protein